MENNSVPVGVAFFVTPNIAITCGHNLRNKNIRDVVYLQDGKGLILQLQVDYIDIDLDFSLLKFNGVRAKHFTMIDSTPTLGTQFIVAGYNLGISEELVVDAFTLDVGIMQGTVVKVSRNHFLYQSMTFGGDSGSALTLVGGNVIGIHLAGINEARERIDRLSTIKERLNEVEHSVDSLIKGTAQGCLGLLAGVIMKVI